MGGSDFFAAAGFDSSFFSFFSLFSPLSAFFSFFSPLDLSARAKTNASIALSHPSPSSSPLASSRVASRAFVSFRRLSGDANESRVVVVVRAPRTHLSPYARRAVRGFRLFYPSRASTRARGGVRRKKTSEHRWGSFSRRGRFESRARVGSRGARVACIASVVGVLCVNKSRSSTRYLSRRLVIR